MVVLPSNNADYDNYIHFNHINRKIEVCYMYVHSSLHIYKDIKSQIL